MSNLTLPTNVEFLLKALKELKKVPYGVVSDEANRLLAEAYDPDRDAIWKFIKTILDLISKAQDMVNATEQILKAHESSIRFAVLLAEICLQKATRDLLNALEERVEKESHQKDRGVQFTVDQDNFLEIINAGAKEWKINEAILAAAEYLSDNTCTTTRVGWTNNWIVKNKIIPTLRAHLK
jgi:hypothetical protein